MLPLAQTLRGTLNHAHICLSYGDERCGREHILLRTPSRFKRSFNEELSWLPRFAWLLKSDPEAGRDLLEFETFS